MGESRILIVRHGDGRGRSANPNYLRRPLRHIEREQPDLHRRLVFHRTGEPLPSLDGISAIVFWLKNPLRRYPACHAEARRLADEARARSITLINPPEALAEYSKSRQGRLWRAAGVPTPEVERFETFASLNDAADRLHFPLILRADEQHSQKATHIIKDRDALRALKETDLIFPCAASPFIDLRPGYRETTPRSALARLFHKKRLIVANGAIRSKHVMFSSGPIVGAKSCILNGARRFGRFEDAFLLRPLYRKCAEQDVAYWQRGEEQAELMLKACDALGLKYAAIDYSTSSDGTHILWEANPLFGLPKVAKIPLPRRRRAAERVASYNATIANFLRGLLAD